MTLIFSQKGDVSIIFDRWIFHTIKVHVGAQKRTNCSNKNKLNSHISILTNNNNKISTNGCINQLNFEPGTQKQRLLSLNKIYL